MAGRLCDAIEIQFEKTIKITRELIDSFSGKQWMQGISNFEVPVKVAYHIVDCLDFYFREDKNKKYLWGHRFDGSWEELADDAQPSQKEVVQYLDDMALRIQIFFQRIDDGDLSTPYTENITILGHCIYAIRHTMHHQGALTALAVYHQCDPDRWE